MSVGTLTDIKRSRILIGTAVAILAAAYVVLAYAMSGSTGRGAVLVLPGREVPASRVSAADLRSVLDTQAAAALAQPVKLDVGGSPGQLIPAESGLGFDAATTAESATAFTLNPVTLWAKTVGGQRIEPVTTVDEAPLRSVLGGIADRFGTTNPVEAAVAIQAGKPVVTQPEPGRSIKIDDALAAVRDGWTSQSVTLPITVTQPTVGQEALDKALAEVVTPALSGPVKVNVGAAATNLTPAQIGSALTLAADGQSLTPKLDGAVLRAHVLKALPAAVSSPVNARFDLESGKPRIVPGKNGTTLDPAAVSNAVMPALTAQGAQRVVTLAPVTSAPAVTTKALQDLKITQEMSHFSIGYPYNPPRTSNIRTAAKKVNGTVLKPGETFSLNGILGERTAAAGYRQAAVIEGGVLVEGYGGGVSQVASTLFNGMFFAGLKDVEHHPHSIYFTRYPEGREATLDFHSKDLRFTNDSGHGVLIQMWLQDGELHTRFWGTKVYDIKSSKGPRYAFTQGRKIESKSPRCIASSPKSGFSVVVTRIFNQGGKEVKREKFTTVYNPEHEVVCLKDQPKPKPSSSAKPTPAPSPSS